MRSLLLVIMLEWNSVTYSRHFCGMFELIWDVGVMYNAAEIINFVSSNNQGECSENLNVGSFLTVQLTLYEEHSFQNRNLCMPFVRCEGNFAPLLKVFHCISSMAHFSYFCGLRWLALNGHHFFPIDFNYLSFLSQWHQSQGYSLLYLQCGFCCCIFSILVRTHVVI